jgi:hypothetical protein
VLTTSDEKVWNLLILDKRIGHTSFGSKKKRKKIEESHVKRSIVITFGTTTKPNNALGQLWGIFGL